MITRRRFLANALLSTSALGLIGCGKELAQPAALLAGTERAEGEVVLYDTYAQALYFDGSFGPKTGIIKVDYILADRPITLEFWHGHGSEKHHFILTPTHFAELKQLKRVYVETTEAANHTHRLFIDPVDPRWRVPGAKPISVPLP